MAKVYTSTIDVRCWKEHTCAGCGAVYAYELIRKVKGQGATAEKATANARTLVQKTLQTDVDLEPCPTCGCYQPDMIGQLRARRHRWVFWLALLAFVVILILYGTDVIQANTATWAVVIACVGAALSLWEIELGNLNRDTTANSRLAQQRVHDKKVIHQPGRMVSGRAENTLPPRSLGNRVALAMLLVAVALAASPEIRRSTHHWPLNRDSYPPVVGPGDQARIYMTQKISSVKGYWRGKPYVTIHEPDPAAKPLTVDATTNQNDWGSTISVKSSEKSDSSTPWVNVSLPPDVHLAGKTITCDIGLSVAYPQATGSSSFTTRSQNLQRSVPLYLASIPSAGSQYRSWWQTGTLLAMALILLSAILLRRSARALQRQAKPTRLFTLGQTT